jgi:hypothetical protein
MSVFQFFVILIGMTLACAGGFVSESEAAAKLVCFIGMVSGILVIALCAVTVMMRVARKK